jgi:hypothetical protein
VASYSTVRCLQYHVKNQNSERALLGCHTVWPSVLMNFRDFDLVRVKTWEGREKIPGGLSGEPTAGAAQGHVYG